MQNFQKRYSLRYLYTGNLALSNFDNLVGLVTEYTSKMYC